MLTCAAHRTRRGGVWRSRSPFACGSRERERPGCHPVSQDIGAVSAEQKSVRRTSTPAPGGSGVGGGSVYGLAVVEVHRERPVSGRWRWPSAITASRRRVRGAETPRESRRDRRGAGARECLRWRAAGGVCAGELREQRPSRLAGHADRGRAGGPEPQPVPRCPRRLGQARARGGRGSGRRARERPGRVGDVRAGRPVGAG